MFICCLYCSFYIYFITLTFNYLSNTRTLHKQINSLITIQPALQLFILLQTQNIHFKLMNDYKIFLNKRQQYFLSRMLPKGYSFQLYKVRKNINDYPYKQFDKKYKKTQSIILSKKQSVLDSFQQSQKSYREKSDPIPSVKQQSYSQLQLDLLNLTKKLKKHDSSYPFRCPVDPKALQIPDYFDVVLEPMDLKTIQQQIKQNNYSHLSQLERDIYKMIMNSYKFNQKSTSTYNKTIQFQEFYVQTIRDWKRTKQQEVDNIDKEKQLQVKQENIMDEQKVQISKNKNNQEISFKLQSFNLWNLKANSVNNNFEVLPLVQPSLQKKQKQAKVSKTSTQIPQQRPTISKKKLPKNYIPISGQTSKAQSPKKVIPQIKKQQPFYDQQLIISQPVQEHHPQSEPVQPISNLIKSQEDKQELINQQLKSYMQNETMKQNNFSQGYNQFISGNKIRNQQVQKQITSLLKRLSQFPLTKQKKNKIYSKFTNLQQNMTQTDKKKLFDKITKLDQNDIQYVVRILTRNKHQLLKQQEFQIDLDKADSKALRQIQNFIALRDNSFASNIQNIFQQSTVTQSLQQIKAPKKIKKQQKKILKKKLSRKLSNDQSFSLNPPQIKKKKSQKPIKKQLKNGQEQSQVNLQIQSMQAQNQQSSSYHPQPIHHNGRVNVINGLSIQKNQQSDKIQNSVNGQKIFLQNKKGGLKQSSRSQGRSQSNSQIHQTNQMHQMNQTHQVHFNNIWQHMPVHEGYHHNEHQIQEDIDQYLVSSKHLHNDNQQEEQGMYGRHIFPNIEQGIDHLDYIDDHNFHIGSSARKDYPDDEIRQYSMQQRRQPTDQNQFF